MNVARLCFHSFQVYFEAVIHKIHFRISPVETNSVQYWLEQDQQKAICTHTVLWCVCGVQEPLTQCNVCCFVLLCMDTSNRLCNSTHQGRSASEEAIVGNTCLVEKKLTEWEFKSSGGKETETRLLVKETSRGRETPLWNPSSQHASGRDTASLTKYKMNKKLNLCVYVIKHQHKSILPSEAPPTLRVLLACDEWQDGLGVVVGLLLTGSARVLPVVGQLVHAAQVTDGVAEGSHTDTQSYGRPLSTAKSNSRRLLHSCSTIRGEMHMEFVFVYNIFLCLFFVTSGLPEQQISQHALCSSIAPCHRQRVFSCSYDRDSLLPKGFLCYPSLMIHGFRFNN